MNDKPLFVLIPGGGMSDWVWKYLIKYLEYPNIMISSRIEPNSLQNRLESTVHDIVDHIVHKIPAEADNIVLVGHSGAGILAAMTAQKIPLRIKHIIFIAANIPSQGSTVLSGLPFFIRWINRYAIRSQIKKDSIPMSKLEKVIRKRYFNGAAEEIIQYALKQELFPEPPCVIDQKMDWIGFPNIGMTYVVLSDDRTGKPELQYKMGKNLNITDFQVIESCHMVMLHKPKELADILNSVV
jgi:pimeloyl-ACP methyl ester carboxylesterase